MSEHQVLNIMNVSPLDDDAYAQAELNSKADRLYEVLGRHGLFPAPELSTYFTLDEPERMRFYKAMRELDQALQEVEDNYSFTKQLHQGAVEAAARAAHEANRVYCASIGDHSQMRWEDAPDWQKKSAFLGALQIYNFPHTSPRESHEGWLKNKALEGWKFGPEKNVDAKEHPCFLPYDELPPAQRAKDSIFGSVVRAILMARLPGWGLINVDGEPGPT